MQGSVSGFRRIFYADFGGVAVGCSHSDVLAELSDATVDEEVLAANLMAPAVPYPVADRSVWSGIRSVPEDCCLEMDGVGRPRLRRRWIPPEPVLTLEEGAPRLAEALKDAVAVRTQGGGVVSADLSGGMDSTSVCFLADQGPAKLVTFTRLSADTANDDESWAKQAAAQLDCEDHLFAHPDDLPGFHADLLHAGEGMDEPVLSGRVRGEYQKAAGWFRAEGSRVHMSGEGGDQILQARPSYMHTTIRRFPIAGLRHVRGNLAQNRWGWMSTLGALADNRSFGRWLSDSAADLSPKPLFSKSAQIGWQAPAQLPPWATPAAVDTVSRLMRREAVNAPPLAPDRGQHSVLGSIRGGARLDRHLCELTASQGVPTSFPFYDDKVIEAALAVRLHERTDPAKYKPLLVGAMGGTVPDGLLGRSTKGEYSTDLRQGLLARRDELGSLLDRPVLAELGLIDADLFRSACFGLYPPRLSLVALESTLLLECWVRSHVGRQGPPELVPVRGSEKRP
ncbi:asparagine synthase-related protein [Saccharopolyspora gloriosae]|uniref:asparagine synthase-related protein n=1 Tax=Saccharopolyspora gloriosae TaxID=455344 RepID=UPI001FB674A2|nr:asparagine synthase-related protein [Saccharopolyspora gloriosae]